jgi:hypothetical protein
MVRHAKTLRTGDVTGDEAGGGGQIVDADRVVPSNGHGKGQEEIVGSIEHVG